MVLQNTGIKVSDHFFKKRLYSAVVLPEIITQVDIQVDLLKFRPGMYGDMTFTQADNAGKATRIECMVNFAKFLQPVLNSQGVYKLFKAAGVF